MTEHSPATAIRWWTAASRGFVDGERALMTALRDRTWRDDPRAWLHIASHLCARPTSKSAHAEFISAFADAFCAGDRLEDAEREIAGQLAGELCERKCPREKLAAFGDWLAKRITPGDASVVVQVLGEAATHEDRPIQQAAFLPRELMPLVRWLLEHGAAELRVHGRSEEDRSKSDAIRDAQQIRGADLLLRIANAVHKHGESELLPIALHYFFRADAARLSHPDRPELLWDLTERGLEQKMSPALVLDAVHAIRRSRGFGPDADWLPLRSSKWPLSARALRDILMGGAASPDLAKSGLVAAMQSGDPVGALNAAAFLPALEAAHSGFHMSATTAAESPEAPRATRWLEEIAAVSAVFLRADSRLHDFVSRELAGFAGRNGPMREGVYRGLERAFPADSKVGAVLRGGLPGYAMVHAALAATKERSAQREAPCVDLSPLREELFSFIHHGWREPVCGVDLDALLDGIHDVQLTDALEDGLKVKKDGATLLFDDDYAKKALGSGTSNALMLSMAYCVHELIHVTQGFSEMSAVRGARAIGAEMTILQVDLASDHVTSIALSKLRPDWTPLHVKRAVASPGFPVGRFHTEASRQRKSMRLVAGRFDLATREHWTDAWDGFFWLDFAPGGTECLAFFSAPLVRLVAPPLKLSDAERKVLVTSCDDQGDARVLRNVDEVVGRLAREAWATRF